MIKALKETRELTDVSFTNRLGGLSLNEERNFFSLEKKAKSFPYKLLSFKFIQILIKFMILFLEIICQLRAALPAVDP